MKKIVLFLMFFVCMLAISFICFMLTDLFFTSDSMISLLNGVNLLLSCGSVILVADVLFRK